jgi:hypothetical protein
MDIIRKNTVYGSTEFYEKRKGWKCRDFTIEEITGDTAETGVFEN